MFNTGDKVRIDNDDPYDSHGRTGFVSASKKDRGAKTYNEVTFDDPGYVGEEGLFADEELVLLDEVTNTETHSLTITSFNHDDTISGVCVMVTQAQEDVLLSLAKTFNETNNVS